MEEGLVEDSVEETEVGRTLARRAVWEGEARVSEDMAVGSEVGD